MYGRSSVLNMISALENTWKMEKIVFFYNLEDYLVSHIEETKSLFFKFFSVFKREFKIEYFFS